MDRLDKFIHIYIIFTILLIEIQVRNIILPLLLSCYSVNIMKMNTRGIRQNDCLKLTQCHIS